MASLRISGILEKTFVHNLHAMTKRKNVAIPLGVHKGLAAAGYSPAFIVRKLIADFMKANNIPVVDDCDENQTAA